MAELAYQLKIPIEELLNWTYFSAGDQRYVTYKIPKRSDGFRTISAPKEPLKEIQRRILALLEPATSFGEPVHGFRPGRSIVTNASRHVSTSTQCRIDIKDFFPSITLNRVQGVFKSWPFLFPGKVAIVLAKLCTFKQQLPQGAPTSPFISNIVMKRCDSRLRKLAHEHGIQYTRYADDLVFSTYKSALPPQVISAVPLQSNLQPFVPNFNTVQQILNSAGFNVNDKKTKIVTKKQRMEVTGIVTNRKSNVRREFIKRIRKLIHLIKKKGVPEASKYFSENLDEKRHRRKIESPELIMQVVIGRIAHVAQVRGEDDLIVKSLRDQLEEAINPGSTDDLAKLRREWSGLISEENAQTRGYRLERFWSDAAKHFGIHLLEPFRAEGEQVDGAVELDGVVYLVECKAISKQVPPREIDALYGKLDRRLEGTRGIFLSLSGFSKGSLSLMPQYSKKRIVLLDQKDMERLLSGGISLADLVKTKARMLATKRILINDPFEFGPTE